MANVFEDASGETPASQLARFNVDTFWITVLLRMRAHEKQLMSMFHSFIFDIFLNRKMLTAFVAIATPIEYTAPTCEKAKSHVDSIE